MARAARDIFIVGAKRTPFCQHGGLMRELPAFHAYAAAAKDALCTANVDPKLVDCTIIANVNYLSQCDGGKTPRYCGLYSGVPTDKPALGVNVACGSGLQSVITSALDIMTGSSKICLAGGTELMSALPFLVRNVRFGTALGVPYRMEDHIPDQFLDNYSGQTLDENAEEIAKRFKIQRNEADQYTLNSYLKWRTAQDTNIFDDEISSLTVTLKKKEITINKDQLQRDLSMEELTNAPSKLDGGNIVTRLNSSAPADGAAALVIADGETVKQLSLKPLARIAGWACVGVNPRETGLGGGAAISKLLKTFEMTARSVDLFEINESFAAQALATMYSLELDPSKVNVNGGALASGHPIGASGARMAVHLAHQMRRQNAKTAIAASSCGGGQGVAVMLERV